jgi:hypothetical protein
MRIRVLVGDAPGVDLRDRAQALLVDLGIQCINFKSLWLEAKGDGRMDQSNELVAMLCYLG